MLLRLGLHSAGVEFPGAMTLIRERVSVMPLESASRLTGRALDQGYAVGYFESWNLESLQGVIDAAEKTRSPVIIGFNGDFLSRPDRLARERLAWYGALGLAAARTATIPCG